MMISIEEDFWSELAQIEVESFGWIPLEAAAYMHIGSAGSINTTVIEVIGLPKTEMQASNLLWLF